MEARRTREPQDITTLPSYFDGHPRKIFIGPIRPTVHQCSAPSPRAPKNPPPPPPPYHSVLELGICFLWRSVPNVSFSSFPESFFFRYLPTPPGISPFSPPYAQSPQRLSVPRGVPVWAIKPRKRVCDCPMACFKLCFPPSWNRKATGPTAVNKPPSAWGRFEKRISNPLCWQKPLRPFTLRSNGNMLAPHLLPKRLAQVSFATPPPIRKPLFLRVSV